MDVIFTQFVVYAGIGFVVLATLFGVVFSVGFACALACRAAGMGKALARVPQVPRVPRMGHGGAALCPGA